MILIIMIIIRRRIILFNRSFIRCALRNINGAESEAQVAAWSHETVSINACHQYVVESLLRRVKNDFGVILISAKSQSCMLCFFKCCLFRLYISKSSQLHYQIHLHSAFKIIHVLSVKCFHLLKS